MPSTECLCLPRKCISGCYLQLASEVHLHWKYISSQCVIWGLNQELWGKWHGFDVYLCTLPDWRLVEYFSFSTLTIPLEYLSSEKNFHQNWVQSFFRLHFLWIFHQAILIKISNLRVILTEGTFVTVSIHFRNCDLNVTLWETQIYSTFYVCSWNKLQS